MKTDETKNVLAHAGLKWEDFLDWMDGHTVGIRDGEVDYYECDVSRFVRNKGCTKCDCRFAPVKHNQCPCVCHA